MIKLTDAVSRTALAVAAAGTLWSTAALADPEGKIQAVVEGRCNGIIVNEPRGSGGFGYDPLFLIPEYHRTCGELSARVKHALSHRARALERLRPVLKKVMLGH